MRQITKVLKNLPVNMALFCIVLLLSLIAIDTALFFSTQTRFNWHKIQIETEDDGGFLYYIATTTPALAPENKPYRRIFMTKAAIAQLPNSIYVPFDRLSRKKGFFPDRDKTTAIIGDSFSIGEGVGNKETLGWFLGQEYHDYNFVNYGEQGIGTDSVCDLIRDFLLPQKDRIKNIIYFYNLNDVFHTWPKEALTDFENISYRDMPLGGLLKHSTLLSLIRRANIMHDETKRTIGIYKDIYFGSDNKINVEKMFDTITATDKELKHSGVNFHVVLYPLLHKNLLGKYPLAPIHDMIKTRLNKNGVSCLDAADAFRNTYFMSRMRVNPADYHPNGKANRLVARFIKENIRLTDPAQ